MQRRSRGKNPSIQAFPSIALIRKKCGFQQSQFVASEFGNKFVDYSTCQVHSCFGKKLCIQKNFTYFFFSIIVAAITNIFHIAMFKHTPDHKICFCLVVYFYKVNIPKDPFVEDWFSFSSIKQR